MVEVPPKGAPTDVVVALVPDGPAPPEGGTVGVVDVVVVDGRGLELAADVDVDVGVGGTEVLVVLLGAGGRLVVVVVAAVVVVVLTGVAPGTKYPLTMAPPDVVVVLEGGYRYSNVPKPRKATTIRRVERRMGRRRCTGTDMNPTRALWRTPSSSDRPSERRRDQGARDLVSERRPAPLESVGSSAPTSSASSRPPPSPSLTRTSPRSGAN